MSGAIRDLVETWVTATRAGDIHTVLDLMTHDAVFMTPGNPPFGKEAFKRAAEEWRLARDANLLAVRPAQ